MKTSWQGMVNWFSVAAWAHDKACFERQREGRCNCRSGRKGKRYNPCDRAIGIEQDATALGCDEQPSGDWTIVAMIDWIIGHGTCHTARQGQTCNHKGCDRTAHLVNWLQLEQRKAA